jgi:SAM-dependent methyltransferase
VAEFTVAVENYDRFMGRYATGLAPKFADAAGVGAGMRVLDVGCGTGALAVGRVGEDNVAAIDPTPQFAVACHARIPGADIREGVAESLPWDDDTFDAAMCSLVVAWMSDADQGIGEMARVTKPGGTVAAAMWDLAGGGLGPIRVARWNPQNLLDRVGDPISAGVGSSPLRAERPLPIRRRAGPWGLGALQSQRQGA